MRGSTPKGWEPCTSSTYLAMRMLGYENVRTYFGSWNEWAQDDSFPIEEVAPRGEQKV